MRGGRRPDSLRAFQATLVLFVVTGVVGLWLHCRANVEFEVERDSTVGGMHLFWKALGGALPALAGTTMFLAAIGYAVVVSRRQALASPRS